MTVLSPVRGLLASKSYLLLGCGTAIFTYQAGREVINVLLPAIQDEFGLGYTQLGLLTASYDWGHAAMLLLGGYLSDRYGKVRCLLLGLAWFAAANAVVGLSSSPWVLMGLRFATGVAFGTYFTAGNSLIADAFPPSERGRAMGLHYAGGSAGRFIIPIVSGIITVSLGWRLAFLPLTLAAVVAGGLFLFLKAPSTSFPGSDRLTWQTLRAKVLVNRQILKVSAMHFLVLFVNMAIMFVPIYLVRVWGLSIAEAAFYTGTAAVAGIFGSPVVGELSDRLGWKQVILVTLVANALLLGAIPLTIPGPALVAVLVALGIVNRAISVVLAVATRISEPSIRGVSLGFVNMVGLFSITVLSVLGGYVADRVGLAATFYFVGLVAILSVLALGMSRLGRLELKW